ncbi:MAG: hypothetical protein WCS94_21885, partial [Verrucomicrobiota bacterium]
FGPIVPAHGFWVRHARDVNFFNVQVSLNQPDARPFIDSGGDTDEMRLNGNLVSPVGGSSANNQ